MPRSHRCRWRTHARADGRDVVRRVVYKEIGPLPAMHFPWGNGSVFMVSVTTRPHPLALTYNPGCGLCKRGHPAPIASTVRSALPTPVVEVVTSVARIPCCRGTSWNAA
jgi:hypothetical protein